MTPPRGDSSSSQAQQRQGKKGEGRVVVVQAAWLLTLPPLLWWLVTGVVKGAPLDHHIKGAMRSAWRSGTHNNHTKTT